MQISFVRKKRSIINRSFPLSRGILPKKFHNARGIDKEISEFCAGAEISARSGGVSMGTSRGEDPRRRRGRSGEFFADLNLLVNAWWFCQ
jgi:hypothetical protein